ncbi:MAG: hypothetical protein O8C66_08475 [Candidatus Methanoperedens sp.]|nr:hypothetical protein [Candidatus Methanoperedens sp.]MCZ7370532.1 hypothetical protein [Candidatus Methanoperedens sp.]
MNRPNALPIRQEPKMKSFQLIWKVFLFIGALLVIMLPSGIAGSIAAAQNQDVVYDDKIAEQWANGTWDCASGGSPEYNLSQSEVVHSGNYAIEVNHSSPYCQGGWGALDLDRRNEQWTALYWMYPNQYKNLSFYFNPGHSLDNLGALSITADNGYTVRLIDYINGTASPDTWYHINIPLEDFNRGNKFFRIVFWFTSSGNLHYYLDDISLEWIDDPNPPLISNVSVTNITWKSAEVRWQTDEYTNSTLYSVAGDNNFSYEETDYTREHKIILTNLTPSTTYRVHIISRDHQANASVSANIAENYSEFTTAPPDVIPPVISNVWVSDIKSDRASIYWTTDEPADSRVYYGENNYSANKTDDSLTTSHRVVITGLKLLNSYQYKVASQDESRNLAAYEETPPMNFTTTAYPAATLQVNAANKTRPFSRNILGAGLGNWAFWWGRPYPNDSLKLRELTKLIKPGVLRYAGGLASNSVTWDRNNTQHYAAGFYDKNGVLTWGQRQYYNPGDPLTVGYDRCNGTTPIRVENAYDKGYQKDEIDALAAFAKYVGADVMIEVDISTCDPELWADMLNYTNVENNYNFKYWELGNELDLEKAAGKPVPFGSEYVSRFKKYSKALKAVDNSILITGPTTASYYNESYFRAYIDFIDPLTLDPEIQQNKSLDVLSYHYYPLWNHDGGVKSYEDMFAFDSRKEMDSDARDKRELLDNRNLTNTRIAISEFNSMAADLATSYTFNHANALYMADTLARQANSGADMIMHWELYDQPYDSTGKLDTSYGLLNYNGSSISIGYPPSREITIEDKFFPMPVYYTYFMYAQFFGDMLVRSSSSMEDNLSIWASTDSAQPNTLKLMVVNLADESVNATLNLSGFHQTGGRYFEMTNDDFVTAPDKAKVFGGTKINGLEINSSSAQSIIDSAQRIIDSGRPVSDMGNSFNHVFPAYSATVIVLNTTASQIQGVTNLSNVSYASNYINWTWTDPADPDFDKVMVYLNGNFQRNVTKGTQYYNATVAPGTYTIGTRTVDTNGNINATMVTHTATTVLPSIRFINGTVMDSVNKTGIAGVSVSTNTSLSTTTNSTGFYSFAVAEGTYSLTATFDISYYTNSTIVSTIGSAVVVKDIELVKKPTGTITGSVTST